DALDGAIGAIVETNGAGNGGVVVRGRAARCVPGAAEPPCAATDPGVPPPPLNRSAADAPPATTTPDRPRTARPRMTALSRMTRMGGTPDWARFRDASRLPAPLPACRQWVTTSGSRVPPWAIIAPGRHTTAYPGDRIGYASARSAHES